MTRLLFILILLAATSAQLLGQMPASKDEGGGYLVPFDTKGNRIELAVANSTAKPTST